MDDLNELSKVLSDPESMQYYHHSFNQEEVKDWIEWNIVFDTLILPKVDGIACPKIDKYNDLILSEFWRKEKTPPLMYTCANSYTEDVSP